MQGGGIESLPEGSVVVEVGPGSFVMPWPFFRATDSQLARIETAAMLGVLGLVTGQEGLEAERRRLLGSVEAEMAKEARRRARIPEGRAVAVHRDDYIEDGPLALVPGRVLGLPVADHGEGRVYSPDQMRGRPIGQVEDHDPTADEGARLDGAALSPGQAWRLSTAEFYTERATALREARPKGARITDEEKAAATTSRRILLQLRREVVDQAEADAVRRHRLHAEHLADQVGRSVRLNAMRNRRARLIEAGVNRWDRVRHLWAYRATLRANVTRRNVDGLKLVALNPIQLACAEWYRALYQRTERGARVASWEGRAGGGREDTREAAEWGADQIIRKQVESRVMAEAKGNGRMITTLRLVAGEGRTINAISGGKSQNRKLNTEALTRALDIVADYRGMQ